LNFEQLGLSEPILRAVAAEGYCIPTPIQVKAIPHVLEGRDLLGCAQTGTGKTAAFALPILHRLAAHAAHSTKVDGHHHPAKTNGHVHRGHAKPQAAERPIRALILCPTRELASQIADSFRAYGRNLHVRHTVIFGGVNQHHQVRALKAGVDILIATPGRLMDLMEQGYIDLRHVEIFVLDEADRMLDMGFIPDIRRIVKHIPTRRQTLLFSATMPTDIRKLADSILHNPTSVHVNPVSSTVEAIAQSVYFVPRPQKPALLAHLLKTGHAGAPMQRTLVFTRTKRGADKVVKHLTRAGIRAEAIHGNKTQGARTRALNNFKAHKPPVLVATDIASRGIDVDNVTHVVNYDMPDVPETYVHRIGRTARAGASGAALSFCDHEERNDLKIIERLSRVSIAVHRTPADLKIDAAPVHDFVDRDPASRDAADHRRGRQQPHAKGARQQHPRASSDQHASHKRGSHTHAPHGHVHAHKASSSASHAPAKTKPGPLQRGRGRSRGHGR
jgi:ATP-dependent RNA helicase RhlE